MKKIVSLFFALMLNFAVNAQTPLTEAVDFTSEGLNGEDIHLFEILDGGQYVLIEFFYSNSSGALTYVNKMIGSYQYFGCNQHDVYFMEVSRYDDEAEARAWCNEYGVEFPTIHTESEGDTGDQICSMYGIPSFPTVILIAPDRQIVLQDIWPVLYTDDIINALIPFGIEQHECSVETVAETFLTETIASSFTVNPNPAKSVINIKSDNASAAVISICDISGRCVKRVSVNDISNATINIEDLNKGLYLININGKVERLVVE